MKKSFAASHDCPACGAVHTHVSPFNCADAPRSGDVSVCIRCGSINEFDQAMQLRVVPALACAGSDMHDARVAQARVRKHLGLPYVRIA